MKPPKFYRITDYDRSLLPNPLLRRLEDGVTNQQQWMERTGLSPGHPVWGILYHVVLGVLDPEAENLIVETGTNWGTSTIALAQALKDSGRRGRCLTAEIDPDNHAKALGRFAEAGVADVIDARLGDSIAVLAAELPQRPAITFAYLDGAHTFDHVMGEFALVHPRLAPGAMVVFDNTYAIAEPHEDQRMHGALIAIKQRYGGNIVHIPYVSWYTPGLAIWQG